MPETVAFLLTATAVGVWSASIAWICGWAKGYAEGVKYCSDGLTRYYEASARSAPQQPKRPDK